MKDRLLSQLGKTSFDQIYDFLVEKKSRALSDEKVG